MNLFSFKNRISGFAWIFFLFIAAASGLFLYVTQERNATRLEQQRFRVLEGLAGSVKEKDETLSRMVANLEPAIRDLQARSQTPVYGKAIPPSGKITKAGITPEPYDSVRARITRIKNTQMGNNLLSEKLNTSFSRHAPPADSISYRAGSDSLVSFALGIDEFIKPLLKYDLFSHYFVIRENRIVFNMLPDDLILPTTKPAPGIQKNLGLNFPAVYTILAKDTLQQESGKIRSGRIETITLSGVDYRVFIQPVRFHHNSITIYVGGVVAENTFTGWKRNLPPTWILIFILLILFILFSIPFLQLRFAGIFERITHREFSLTILSLFVCTLVLFILFSAILLKQQQKQHEDRCLKEYNDRIGNAFTGETGLALQQMVRYDSLLNVTGLPAGSGTVALVLKDLFNDTLYRSYLPACYPFFKSVFWADEAGIQQMILTPYASAALTNISYRNYFKEPERYFRKIHADSVWYGMEPVFSNTTGEWLFAVSMPSTCRSLVKPVSNVRGFKVTAPVSWKPRIVALTAPFCSLKNVVLPAGYEFVLLGKSGEVWYHSKETLTLGSRFSEECSRANALAAALKSGRPTAFTTSYHQRAFRMFIAPVRGTDLFLVTLLDPAGIEHTGVASLFFASGNSLFFLLLMLILLISSQWIPGIKKRTRNFFSLLEPSAGKRGPYKILILVNGIISLFLLGGLLITRSVGLPHFYLVRILVITLFIQSTFTLVALIFFKQKKSNAQTIYLSWFSLFLISWILLLCVISPAILCDLRKDKSIWQYITEQQRDLSQQVNERTDLLYPYYKNNIPFPAGFGLYESRNREGLFFDSTDAYQLQRSAIYSSEKRCRGCKDSLSAAHVYLFNDSLRGIQFQRLSYGIDGTKSLSKAQLVSRSNRLDLLQNPYGTGFLSILFWMVMLLVLLMFFFLIRKISGNYFLKSPVAVQEVTLSGIIQSFRVSNDRLILVSPHQTEISGLTEVCFVDLQERKPKRKVTDTDKFILINFDAAIEGRRDLRRRIRLVMKCIAKYPVILCLKEPPASLVNRLSQIFPDEKKRRKTTRLLMRFEQAIKRLPVIFATSDDRTELKPAHCNCMNKILTNEFRFNPDVKDLLPRLRYLYPDCWNSETGNSGNPEHIETCKNSGQLIQEIGNYLFTRYAEQWKTLSFQEQFVLLNVVQDRLIHVKHADTLKLLIQKGILEASDDIRCVSPSFAAFVLHSADRTGLNNFLRAASYGSRWSHLRQPLILIATACLILLVMTQQNFLSTLNTILVSVTAILGVYVKISGIFSPEKGVGNS
jgi:hypothetical protein